MAGPENTERARFVRLFLGVLLVAELVLGAAAYLRPRDNLAALVALIGGAFGLAWIDLYARPHADDPRPRWFRPYLAAWCVLPFVCALAGSGWMHYQKWQEGLADIRQVGADLLVAVPAKHPGKSWREITMEEVNDTVADLVSHRFGPDAKSAEAERFGELARVVGHDLRHERGDLHEVRADAERDTTAGFALAIAVQALFVLWIPVLLAVAIARARRRLIHHQPVAGAWLSLEVRDRRILAEDQPLFLPRLIFGALLVLGTNYVFAPLGLKATYIMGLVDEHALPGHTSWTLWSTSFAEVPVIVVGFVGFLLYALITATQRFVQDDLDDQAVLSLLVRGLVVMLLSLALSSSPMNDTISRLFVFVAGVFPVRALEAIAKKVNVSIDPDFAEAPASFEGLASLDSAKVFALRAAGIQSTYDLAATPIEDIARRVRIDPRLLGRAIDRALLIDAIGLDLAKALEPFAISSATELVALRDAMPEAVTAKFGDAPVRVAKRLFEDPRFDVLVMWLAGASDQVSGTRSKEGTLLRATVGARIQDEIRRLLVADDRVERIRKSPDLRGALLDLADDVRAEIEKLAFLKVDLSAFGIAGPLSLPYAGYDDFNELTDDIYDQLQAKVSPYQYGKEWVLVRQRGGDVMIEHARMIKRLGWGRRVEDRRALSQAGIEPGDLLYVRPVTQGT